MAKITFTIKGAGDMAANTAAMMAKIRDGVTHALDETSLETLDAAVERCPIGSPESTGIPGYIGGTLQSNIAVTTPETYTRDIGVDLDKVPYAWYVHDGTVKMAARPYLTQGFEATKDALVSHSQDIKL